MALLGYKRYRWISTYKFNHISCCNFGGGSSGGP